MLLAQLIDRVHLVCLALLPFHCEASRGLLPWRVMNLSEVHSSTLNGTSNGFASSEKSCLCESSAWVDVSLAGPSLIS